ncbi:hypothetical protein [Candidatus Terasakiella magnetica]|nr:hypothetical protein [Candidatus Terasakiella magnetica]
MKRAFLGLFGAAVLLTGCYTPTLIGENRDGVIVYYRSQYYARTYSDQAASQYCLSLQKPYTWIATVSTRKGYKDQYKCGKVPPSKLSTLRAQAHEDREQTREPRLNTGRYEPERYEEERYERERDEPMSGDYFRSRSSSSDDKW